MVADPKALHYILHTPGYNFPKRTDILKVTELVTGKALVCTHGTEHTLISMHPFLPFVTMHFFLCFVPGKVHERQRKIMAPTFFAPQLKVYLPMFQDAASKVFTVYPLGIVSPVLGWWMTVTHPWY